MDRTKTVELMPIVWRLGTGKAYIDYPRAMDLAAVGEMGERVVPLLNEWLEDDCQIMRTGAAAALARLAFQRLDRASLSLSSIRSAHTRSVERTAF